MTEQKVCNRETEVYSRVVGFYSPTKLWNKGKKEEWGKRKTFGINALNIPSISKKKYRRFPMTQFIELVEDLEKKSTCIRKQVGAVLVKNGVVLGRGFNGVIEGNTCKNIFEGKTEDESFYERHHKFSRENERHAEISALIDAGENFKAKDYAGSSLFVSLSPCLRCAEALVKAGVKEVFYLEEYDRETEGLKFLKENGVRVEKI